MEKEQIGVAGEGGEKRNTSMNVWNLGCAATKTGAE